MDSTTEKLPKGRSYPLKPSALSSALEEAGVASPIKLTRWDKFDAALTGYFNPDGLIPWEDGEHFSLFCKAVSSEEAAALRAVIADEAIPQFVQWVRSIERQDRRSPTRREKQTFRFPYPKLEG